MKVDNIDDRREFFDVMTAMETLQFPKEFQRDVLRIIAAVLHLGNIKFSSTIKDNIEEACLDESSSTAVKNISTLLQVQEDDLKFALAQKVSSMGGREQVTITLNLQQAIDTRDTLAKTLYSNLFDHIIKTVDEGLHSDGAKYSIGMFIIVYSMYYIYVLTFSISHISPFLSFFFSLCVCLGVSLVSVLSW
jgi:myosin heavy subunit